MWKWGRGHDGDRQVLPVWTKRIVSLFDLTKVVDVEETEFCKFAFLDESAMFTLTETGGLFYPFSTCFGV